MIYINTEYEVEIQYRLNNEHMINFNKLLYNIVLLELNENNKED